jgi:hypothetical protein
VDEKLATEAIFDAFTPNGMFFSEKKDIACLKL